MKLFKNHYGKMGAFAQLAIVVGAFIIFAVLIKPEVGQWILELVDRIFGAS